MSAGAHYPWTTRDGNAWLFGEVSWMPGQSNREIYTRSNPKRYVKKPGSSARCHTYRVMTSVRKNYTNGKRRGRKGSRRVKRA